MKNTLGHRLKTARVRTGLTQIDAAKKLGISNGTLSGYERNYRDPDTIILDKMASLYGVSSDWLLGRKTKEAPTRDASLEEKLKFFAEIESEIGIDLSDPKMQEMLKRAAKIMFSDKE